MAHTAIVDPARAVTIQPGAVVSKVLHRGDGLDVTVFGFDAGEGLTEHTASRAALVQVLTGLLHLTVDDEEFEAGPGAWIFMAPGAAHSLVAEESTVMLLTLLPP